MAASALSMSDHLAIRRLVAKNEDIPEVVRKSVAGLDSGSILGYHILRAIPIIAKEDENLALDLLHRLRNTLTVESRLAVAIVRRPKDGPEQRQVLGVVSAHSDLITTAGVNFLVGILDGTNVTATAEKYHALGTGTTAAAIGDTALQAELAASSYTGGVRATGTAVVGSSNNIYQTVATNTIPGGGAAAAITEIGLMTQAALGGGTLVDHFVFAAINVVPTDSLQDTINITYNAGG